MINWFYLLSYRMVLFSTVLVFSVAATAHRACEAFDEDERRAYIAMTSQFARPIAAGRNAVSRSRTTVDGIPTLLRGLTLPSGVWKPAKLFQNRRAQVLTQFSSVWGKATLFTEPEEAENLWIVLEAKLKDRRLGEREVATLRKIYPLLSVTQDLAHYRSQLALSKSILPEGESFEEMARSLLATLFYDPLNILNLGQVPLQTRFEVPKHFLNLPALADHQEFLGNIGEWGPVHRSQVYVERASDSPALRFGVQVHLRTKTLTISLQTTLLHRVTLANLRRIVSAAAETGLISTLGGLPKTSINGTESVSIDRLPISNLSVTFVESLERLQREGDFDLPLQGLSESSQHAVRVWLSSNDKLNQKCLNPNRIWYEEIVARNIAKTTQRRD